MTKKTSNRFAPEVRERAVRMVLNDCIEDWLHRRDPAEGGEAGQARSGATAWARE
jgi:hypothetical protein